MPSTTSRRYLLQSAASLAGGLALGRPAARAEEAMPKIRLGDVDVSRVICGANPMGGYSHFNNQYSAHMKEWYTEERMLEVLSRLELNGINTWQWSYDPKSASVVQKHRRAGGKLNFVVLSHGEMTTNPSLLREVANLKPIGIVHHGGVTDTRFRNGEMDKVRDFLKRVRDSGVKVGLSMHNPLVMEYVEERGWDLDFYMTCMYQVTRTREEIIKLLGQFPLGELFLEDDPARMCERVRKTSKTCLAFKILAAGRVTDSPKRVEAAFRFAFENIKPKDAVIVGMYPRYKDEVAENAGYARRFGAVTA